MNQFWIGFVWIAFAVGVFVGILLCSLAFIGIGLDTMEPEQPKPEFRLGDVGLRDK